jgi:hypothetical protein
MKNSIKYWIGGVLLLCFLSILLVSVWWKSLRLLPPAGWVIGYHRRGDLVRISLRTGDLRQLLPPEIENGHRLAAPAIAFHTPTIYYVDRTTGTLMAYTQGESTPTPLYHWPMKSSPVKNSPIQAYSDIADHIEWLLLTPDEETLYFIESSTMNFNYSRLIEYTLRTRHYRVVTASRFDPSTPAVWLNSSQLLLDVKGKLVTIDPETRQTTELLELDGMWAVSPDHSRLLIISITAFEAPVNFTVYEFPSLRLLKTVPVALFAKYDGLRDPFCFVDNERILLGLRKDGVIAEMFTAIHLFDLRTMKHRRVATYLDDLFYLPSFPN